MLHLTCEFFDELVKSRAVDKSFPGTSVSHRFTDTITIEGITFGHNVLFMHNRDEELNVKIGHDTVIFGTTVIGNNVAIGKSCLICKDVFIEDYVSIGDLTSINSYSHIGSNTSIGKRCKVQDSRISDNSTIDDNVDIVAGRRRENF